MSHEAGVPRLPEPTQEWSTVWMRDFIRVLTYWMQRMVAETKDEAAADSFYTVTTNTSLAQSDRYILVDTSVDHITITLPDAGDVPGRDFIIKRITGGVHSLTIVATSGNIDGAASQSMPTQYMSFTFKSDGTDYWIV